MPFGFFIMIFGLDFLVLSLPLGLWLSNQMTLFFVENDEDLITHCSNINLYCIDINYPKLLAPDLV